MQVSGGKNGVVGALWLGEHKQATSVCRQLNSQLSWGHQLILQLFILRREHTRGGVLNVRTLKSDLSGFEK